MSKQDNQLSVVETELWFIEAEEEKLRTLEARTEEQRSYVTGLRTRRCLSVSKQKKAKEPHHD